MTREAPHDAAAERALLGSVLLSPKRARAAFESVPPDAFFVPQHRDIAIAIQALLTRQEPIDPVTVMHELRVLGRTLALEGGEDYLPRLAADVATPETAMHYADIVRSKAAARALVLAASEAINKAMSGEDAGVIAEELGAAVSAAATGRSEKLTHAGDVMLSVLEGIESRAGWERAVSGVPFGLSQLDEATTGLQPGNLVVIGGRPGSGKTGLAMQAAYNCCADGGSAIVFNCEMTRAELVERMIAHVAQVNSQLLRSGQELSGRWNDINAAARRIANTLLYIEDDVTKPRDMCARARAWRAKHPDKKGVIVADYLQMMQVAQGKGQTQAQVLGEAVQSFKMLAKELRVPFVLAVQLNRDNQKDDGRPPRASDIKGTGDAEQAADVIVLIHNTEQTGDDVCDVMLEKNRHGPRLTVRARFVGRYFRFEDV